METPNLPLGRKADYPQNYAPGVLCPIARSGSRERLGMDALPFTGVDIWNAWELTWLNPRGRPEVATPEIRVPAESPNLVESKSLKLYLGSFAMTRFDDRAAVARVIENDLSACAGAPVEFIMEPECALHDLEGICIDDLDVECDAADVDAGLLRAAGSATATEVFHTHLLRSLCPVTGQPDLASLQVAYAGPRIDPASLLQYVVSYREHSDFHEACVERMFVDIMARCRPQTLSIYARYTRRGGIDINPFRSSAAIRPHNARQWRQ